MDLDQILQIVEASNIEQVQYVVVGGIAVNFQGIPRYTEDLDLFVRLTHDNMERLRKALKSVYNDPSVEELSVEEFETYSVIRYGTPDDFYIFKEENDLQGELSQ